MSYVQTNIWCPNNITHPKLSAPNLWESGDRAQMPCTHQDLSPMQDILLPCFGSPSSCSTLLKAQDTPSSMENKIFPRKVPNPLLLSCFLFLLWEEHGGVWFFFFFKAAFKHLAISQPLSCFSSPSL